MAELPAEISASPPRRTVRGPLARKRPEQYEMSRAGSRVEDPDPAVPDDAGVPYLNALRRHLREPQVSSVFLR